VLDLRTPVPLDREMLIASVRKTGRLVALSETWKVGDATSEAVASVAESLCGERVVPMARVALDAVPRPFAYRLEKSVLPSEEKLAAAIKTVLSR
jgi:acetoin:2,6-dichlorophenolindophenol oxidoreductase subunit beta